MNTANSIISCLIYFIDVFFLDRCNRMAIYECELNLNKGSNCQDYSETKDLAVKNESAMFRKYITLRTLYTLHSLSILLHSHFSYCYTSFCTHIFDICRLMLLNTVDLRSSSKKRHGERGDIHYAQSQYYIDPML